MNLARVTAYHPETNKVDLLFLADNRRVPGVRVMGAHASTSSGRVGQAIPDGQNGANPLAVPAAGERALIACVAYYDGVPVVQGFLQPADSELMFADHDRVMDRTPSDFYHTVDGKANAEWFHPSGAYVRIGTSAAHEDLTGKDYHRKFTPRRNRDQKVHIHIEQAGGVAAVDIAPDGKITITSKADLQADIEGKVTVNAGGAASIKAPSALVDAASSRFTGNVTIDGGLTVGEGVDVGAGVTAHDDVVGGGISLISHKHMLVKAGTDKSGPPG
jgi:hypothetical protein